MAMLTLADPKQLPTTVGIVEKNPPFAIPFTTLNTANGARVVETGQTASMLMAAKLSDRNRALRGPILSHKKPLRIRPTADAKLKPANRPAPVAELKPTALANRGMKKGGTNRGKVPMAPPMNTKAKLGSLKSRLNHDQHTSIQETLSKGNTIRRIHPSGAKCAL